MLAAGAAAEPWLFPEQSLVNKTVLDQNGTQSLFYEHLIQDKTVAINFVFTRCTAICPLSSAIFHQVRQQLAGRQVELISISVDPAFDTVEQLHKFSQKFGSDPNWHFITGQRSVITDILKNLGEVAVDKNQHSNMVIVGNDASARWIRLYGLPQARQIVEAIDRVSRAVR